MADSPATHYEVLDVSQRATEFEIKAAFRKLALKFHPDKNRAPDADEAFKCIGLAFATLSDKGKRRHYDLYGDDEPEPGLNHMRRRRPPGGGVYADEMSPEDIFNMCDLGVPSCGGAFTPSTRVVSRNDGSGWFLFRV